MCQFKPSLNNGARNLPLSLRLLRTVLAAFLAFAVSPAFAEALQPDWMANGKIGCRTWNARPEPDDSVSWSGSCKDGMEQGQGIEQWFRSGHPGSRIEGLFQNGQMLQGLVTYANGDHYEGGLTDGARSGQGIYTSANGRNRYEGQFLDGKQSGHGLLTWGIGHRYEGQFVNGKQTGQGLLTWANGVRDEGEWHDGRFIGGQRVPSTPPLGR
jgi:hypothetical protein